MLELQVATRLHPGDWMARRDLFLGLTGVRLDDPARREFDALQSLYPEWRSDSAVTQAHRDLERRSMEGRTVADFR
jgi:hypothetical protein